MRYSISNTAEYGDLTRGPRVIGEDSRKAMKAVLAEIQSGEFAREWIAENRAGQENFNRMRAEQANHQIEVEGKQLRSMMDWLDRKSTRLNSSHANISYAVFCLKKKKQQPAL